MEEILVPILIILMVGLSAINKMKKDKKEHSDRKITPPSTNREEMVQETIDTIPQKQSKKNTTIVEPQHDIVSEISLKQKKEIFEKKNLQTEVNNEINLNDTEEFKRAIIYSEILNRKY